MIFKSIIKDLATLTKMVEKLTSYKRPKRILSLPGASRMSHKGPKTLRQLPE